MKSLLPDTWTQNTLGITRDAEYLPLCWCWQFSFCSKYCSCCPSLHLYPGAKLKTSTSFITGKLDSGWISYSRLPWLAKLGERGKIFEWGVWFFFSSFPPSTALKGMWWYEQRLGEGGNSFETGPMCHCVKSSQPVRSLFSSESF